MNQSARCFPVRIKLYFFADLQTNLISIIQSLGASLWIIALHMCISFFLDEYEIFHTV